MGLIHPGLLLGLLAIAAPIAIHFIRSRKYQRVEIGALRFLRVAIRERRRWRRIEDLPLLLARIAAVALLAFLFARPFLPAREKVAPADLEVILLVDVSGSVSGPGFEAVRNAARETLAKIPPNTKVTVAEFADDVRVLEKPDLSALRAIPGARTDYVRAVNWTLDHVAQSDRKHAHVYLISDLQRAALPPAPPRVWPSNTRVTVVRVPPAGKWNAGISKVELLTPFVIEEAVAEVTLSLSGEPAERKREVQFAIEGQPPMTKTIEPPATRAQFRWKPEKEGIVRGVASVASDDAFPEDNSRPFIMRLAHPKRVLMVQGGSPLTPYDGDAYFLDKALAVSGREESRSPFEPRVQFDLTGLESADAVAWCNAPPPTQDGVNALKEFAMRGGAVSFFLGSATNPADFAALIESGLFPGKIQAVDPPVLRAIQTWDQSHEALRRFDGGERGDLRGLLLRDAFVIEAGPDWNVLAALDNGHPVLLTRELGKGRVLVFANPLTRAWSDFPTKRIFLPLMKEWFTWLTRFSADQDAAREIAPGLKESRPIGTYESGGALEVVAPDPAEMDVTVADEAYARRALGLPDENTSIPVGENLRLPKFRERQKEIWPWIALALLALLIFETILADRRSKSREHVS
jgi:hypothetical protein